MKVLRGTRAVMCKRPGHTGDQKTSLPSGGADVHTNAPEAL